MNRVMIVDDEKSKRDAIKDILKSEGYQFIEAGHGKEALRFISQDRDMDIIILDLVMPEMHGYETLARLKHNPETSHIPIIMTSSDPTFLDINKCFMVGADDCFIKPATSTNDGLELLLKVRNLIKLKKTQELLKELTGRLNWLDHWNVSKEVKGNLDVENELKKPLSFLVAELLVALHEVEQSMPLCNRLRLICKHAMRLSNILTKEEKDVKYKDMITY